MDRGWVEAGVGSWDGRPLGLSYPDFKSFLPWKPHVCSGPEGHRHMSSFSGDLLQGQGGMVEGEVGSGIFLVTRE